MIKKNALILLFVLIAACAVNGQTTVQKLGLLSLDSYDKNGQYSKIARVELQKLGMYEIIDMYDIEYMLRQANQDISNCYGKLCLLEAGKTIKADKMFTGSIESFSDRIVISFRIIDVSSATIEKTQTMEFYHYPQEMQRMLEVAIKKMHNVEVDPALSAQIVRPEKYADILNPPIVERLKLNGPRLGFTYFTGATSERLKESKDSGGFEASPVMFQFGYQFETQYLNEGNLQALFEFIPLITGIDQGYIIPSLTILHGLRNNRNGWEFALGPSIKFVPEAKGYYNASGQWTLATDDTPATEHIRKRVDSRGDLTMSTSFVIAVGKTLHSGRLNIPMNGYFIPERDGFRYGFSFGFNAKKG